MDEIFQHITACCQFKERAEPIREVLTWLAENFQVQGVAAGGALRDLWHEKPVKDVDVFVCGLTQQTAHDLANLIQDCPDLQGADVRFIPIFYGQIALDVIGLIEFSHPVCPWPIQIVCLANSLSPEGIVNRIDLGICQIGMALGEDIITQAFLRDAFDRTFTATHSGPNDDTVARFKRIRAKYAHHIFVCPGYDSHGNPIGETLF